MNDPDFSKPNRQAKSGLVVLFFQKLQKAGSFILSLFLVRIGMSNEIFSLGFFILMAIILLITFVLAYLHYQKFTFYVHAEEFIIEKGVFSKEKTTVPFERIQSVHINQNFVQRLIGVVGLVVDTAGSAQKELEIAALSKRHADALKVFLIQQKEKAKIDDDQVVEDKTSSQESKPLLALGFLDLLKIGLTENHLKTAAILFAFINGIFWQYNSIFKTENNFNFFAETGSWLDHWVITWPLTILVFVMIIGIFSVMQSILRFYGLRFYSNSKGVKLISGLLKRVEFQIPISKIQLIKWSSNPLRKMVGFKTLFIKQAGSIAIDDKKSLLIPACGEGHLNRIIHEFFPELLTSPLHSFWANAYLKLQMCLFFAVIPASAIALIGMAESSFYWIAVLWLCIALLYSYQYASKMRLDINSELIRLRKGWLFPNTVLLKFHKLQSIKFQQSIFQKKRNLANLVFYSAAGSFKMWHLNVKLAQKIYDYSLFKIESSKKDWM